ncbi:hypothetical protein HPT28_08025 [Streptomyces sp. JJ38]|nr:hypothetical protein [Streptomyces sp. JJ38]
MSSHRTSGITISRTVVVSAVITALAAFVALTTLWQPWEADRASGDDAGPAAGVDLRDRVADLTAGFHDGTGYHRPSREHRETVAAGVGLVIDGDVDGAARRLAEVDFVVRTFTDSATGRRTAEIADAAGGAERRRGWGRVYLDLSTRAHWSVQIPHPVADLDTELLGVDVLRARPGGVLILAGAHRRAGEDGVADVAHQRTSVFHAVHEELVRRDLPGVQMHGFADDSVPGEDVVVSTGRGDAAQPSARGLADRLDADGFAVCRGWARRCVLEGRGNVQGRASAERGVPFLHVELSRTVREDADRTRAVVAATAAVVDDWR